jgi:hypothetical protein
MTVSSFSDITLSEIRRVWFDDFSVVIRPSDHVPDSIAVPRRKGRAIGTGKANGANIR